MTKQEFDKLFSDCMKEVPQFTFEEIDKMVKENQKRNIPYSEATAIAAIVGKANRDLLYLVLSKVLKVEG
jgi:hypothetical protein